MPSFFILIKRLLNFNFEIFQKNSIENLYHNLKNQKEKWSKFGCEIQEEKLLRYKK